MAVYTNITETELRDFLEDYDLGALEEFEGIEEGVENSNFRITTDSGVYILTIFERRVKEKDLPFFLGLTRHLSQNGIVCPDPIPAKNEAVLATLKNKPAAIISFLQGRPVWPPVPDHCHQVGKLSALMHKAGQDFDLHRDNDLGLSGWQMLFDKIGKGANDSVAGLYETIAQELDFLCDNWPAALPKGAIHADLFHDNIFFRDDRLSGVIDFYFACGDFFAYDLAITLNAWCFANDRTFERENARALISGYQSVRSLNRDEKDAFPILCRGAAMRFLLTRLFDKLNPVEGAQVTVKDPLAWLNRLKFHQSITNRSGYGFA